MKIFKTAVAVDNKVILVDTILHDGHKWLVPRWIENKAEKWRQPALAILLDLLAHDAVSGLEFDFVAHESIPREVIDGQHPQPKDLGFVVVEMPNIRFQVDSQKH